MARRTAGGRMVRNRQNGAPETVPNALSPREAQVLRHVAAVRTNGEIDDDLSPQREDRGAVPEQRLRPTRSRCCPPEGSAARQRGDRDLHLQGLLPAAQRRIVRNRPVQPRQPQQARDHPVRQRARTVAHRARTGGAPVGDCLAGALCLSGSLNNTLIDRQNWIAASESTGGRPRRPSRGACQAIPLSSQIRREPRFLSAAV